MAVLTCISLVTSDVEHHVFVSHLYVFFGEMSVKVFFPLLDWVVCLSGNGRMSCSYVLEINPLSVVSFAIIQSEVSPKEKNKYYILMHMYGI